MIIYNISKLSKSSVKTPFRNILSNPPSSCIAVPKTDIRSVDKLTAISEEPENNENLLGGIYVYTILTNDTIIGYTTSENRAEEYISNLAKSLMTQKYSMVKVSKDCIEIIYPGYLLNSKIYTIKYEKIQRLI